MILFLQKMIGVQQILLDQSKSCFLCTFFLKYALDWSLFLFSNCLVEFFYLITTKSALK